jgi:parallel beta-helix repeat protein
MEQFEQVIKQRSAFQNPRQWAPTVGKFALFLLLGSILPLPGNAQISCGGNTLCVGAGQQYATIQAAANAAVAGQTVLVMDGTYAGFHSVNSGTPSAPITFKANSSNVIINSAGDSNGDCINIENTDYVIVDGFTLSGCPRAGIRSALSTGVIIRNNVVSNSGMWGIFTGFTPQIQILNNKTSGTTGQHGIYVSNSDVANDNPVIRGNESWGNAQNGIQLNGDCTTPDPSGYTDGIISGALIEDNRVHDNGQKGFSLIGVQSSRIQNNIVYNNGLSGAAGGIHLAEQSGCNDPSSNNVIVNNTIVEPNIAGIRITTGTNNVLFNNIAVSSQPTVDESGGPNAIDSASNIQTSSSSGLFVNPASFDFHLASGSIAIGAGLASYSGQSAPTTDYDGNTRPQGSRWDSGAYEYVAPDDAGSSPSAGIPSGWVNIISKNSGKCLDIMGGPGATWPGDLAQQWDCWNGYNQQFQFTPVNGGYEITARHSGLQLDIEGGPSAVQDGVLLLQWPYWGGSNEIFSVNSTGDGYYTITVLSSGKCLDVSGMSVDNGALVHQWTCWGGDNQKWQIVPAVQ